ncbi:MAG: TolC family protein [Muribaculaceae bacterium]|nr:TolC family protein [Muribaculaceae bacterium]
MITTLPPIDESYNMAMAVDVYMQSLQKEVSAADLDIAVAKASRYPDISLNAGIGTGYYNAGDAFGKQFKRAINESVGLTLSVPILDNKKSKVAVAKAKADKLSKQLDLDYRETEIAQNVEKWYVDVQSSQAKYMAAIEQEKAAEVSNTLVNEQFRLGLVNPVELMTAHNNLLEARHARLQAKYMAILGKKMIEFYRTASISMP